MSDTARSENETYRTETTGDIGDLEVNISIEGGDEQLAEMIYMDLTGRADEIKQMIDHDIPEEMAERQFTINWEEYLEDRKEVEA